MVENKNYKTEKVALSSSEVEQIGTLTVSIITKQSVPLLKGTQETIGQTVDEFLREMYDNGNKVLSLTIDLKQHN